MQFLDARRLTGPSLLFDGYGSILDVACSGDEAERLVPVWKKQVERMLAELGWDNVEFATARRQRFATRSRKKRTRRSSSSRRRPRYTASRCCGTTTRFRSGSAGTRRPGRCASFRNWIRSNGTGSVTCRRRSLPAPMARRRPSGWPRISCARRATRWA
jgi:hypothetical protein